MQIKMFDGLAVKFVGETELFSNCSFHGGFLSLNWRGQVEKVLHEMPKLLSWYECIDKGGIPLYGFDGTGNIVCGVVLIRKGEQNEKGEKYNEDVIYVAKANKTDDWGWGSVGEKMEQLPNRG